MIEKVAQIKSEGKKSLGFGKNDLNIMSSIRFLDIKACGGTSLCGPNCYLMIFSLTDSAEYGCLHFRAFAGTHLVTTFSLPMLIGYQL